MIRRVHAQNFRSIKALTLDLKAFECFVGPNNSGKSNLFDILTFLGDVAREGLALALKSRRAEPLRHYGASERDPVILEVVTSAPESSPYSEMTYTLGFEPEGQYLEREIVNVFREPGRAVTLLSQQWREDGLAGRYLAAGSEYSGSTWGNSALYGLPPAGEAHDALRHLKGLLGGVRRFKFVPDRLKTSGEAKHADKLTADGSNFASFLHTVHSGHKRHFNQIEDHFRKSFPSVEELLTPLSATEPGSTEVGIREKWFEKSAAGHQLSDGLVGFLAYLAVLYGPEAPSLVMFEEPENHMHPRLMEKLVDMLKAASKDHQVFLSTHSVPLIDRLTLEDLVLVERGEDGGTAVRRVQAKEELVTALQGWALGEAYASGAFDEA